MLVRFVGFGVIAGVLLGGFGGGFPALDFEDVCLLV